MLNAYPRPQLKRDSFYSLNGDWAFAITDGSTPVEYPLSIAVPYPPESQASGVMKRIRAKDVMWYRTHFSLPQGFNRGRVILHFGAVDQCANVSLNGAALGAHEGGYLPFSFDITDLLRDENELIVKAVDRLDHTYPWGKQKQKNGGMWYTPFSGIWQTVWIESVPAVYITDLKIKTTLRDAALCVRTNEPFDVLHYEIDTPDGTIAAETNEAEFCVTIPSPRLWSPEDPYLYRIRITVENDTVHSYFALRTIGTDVVNGIPRLCLNGRPYYFHGILDQGYWPDGVCLPPDDKGYARDILAVKALGFNMIRKHIRIEPLTFYEACDRLGMLVLQDMVNNGAYHYLRDTILPTVGLRKLNDKRINRDAKARSVFEKTAKAAIAHLYNAPCVIGWTIFNEGWGQFCADEQYDVLKASDPDRIFDATSGWFHQKKSDVYSEHVYFHRVRGRIKEKPYFLSEFGGYQFSEEAGKHFVYRFFKTQEMYQNAVIRLYRNEIIPAVKAGLCGSVYTQVSDIEEEQNGFLTYDRKKLKIDERLVRQVSQDLFRSFYESL